MICGWHQQYNQTDNWHATEYDTSGTDRLLGAYSDTDQNIQFIKLVAPTTSCPTDSFGPGCAENIAAVRPGQGHKDSGGVELLLFGPSPSQSGVVLGVELPFRMEVHVAVFDVLGRRIQTLADGELREGRTRLTWDGTDARGSEVGSGVYFARLTSGVGRRVVRVLMVK